MTESSHMVGIRGSFDPVLIPFSSFSPFSILGGPLYKLTRQSGSGRNIFAQGASIYDVRKNFPDF